MVSLQIWIIGKITFLGMLRGGREEEGDGRWEMGDGRWEMGDGRWELGVGRWERREEPKR